MNPQTQFGQIDMDYHVDLDEAIAEKSREYEDLTSCTLLELPDRMPKIHDVLYGSDGLYDLLKRSGSYGEAQKLSKEFQRYINYLPKQARRTYDLYRAEAFLKLAELSLIADASGRSASIHTNVQRALEVLSQYEGDNKNEASYLDAIAQGFTSDLFESEDNLDGAIEARMRQKESIEGLVERSAAAAYLNVSALTSLKLAELYRKRVDQQAQGKPSQSKSLLEPAIQELEAAVEKSRRLVEADPSWGNKLTLMTALYQSGEVATKRKDAVAQLKESLDLAKQLQAEKPSGNLREMIGKVSATLRKRQGFLGRLLGL